MLLFKKTLALKIVFWLALLTMSAELHAQSNYEHSIRIFDSLEVDKTRGYKLTHQYADSLLACFKENGDTYRWIKTKLAVFAYQFNESKYKECLTTLFMALSVCQQKQLLEYPLLAQIYKCYGTLYWTLGENKKALYYTEKGIKCWLPLWTDNKVLIQLYLQKGTILKENPDNLNYTKLALQMAIDSKNKIMEEFVLATIGTLYAEAEDYKIAEQYIKQSLALALQRKAYSNLSPIYNNLAGISTTKEQMLLYVDSAYYYALLSGSLEDQQTSLLNKAYYYSQNNAYELAYNNLWEAYVLQDSIFNQDKINAFANMEQKYESVKKTSEIAILKSQNEIATLQSSRRLGISIGLAFILLTFIIVSIVFYKQYKRKQKLNIELSIEKKKSDDLLLNILPEEVADELKQTGMSKARLYNHVTVLFTDFVNFTGISEQLSPTELVQEIHKNFTAFDSIIEKHGLEKIKTIGDAYLAVCGLPNEINNHAERVLNAALDIQSFMYRTEGKFQIRIGVHSGPVVAGIVGVKKYAYDIWGDTVNMANRMESNSEAGKINISGTTFELIGNQFECEYRGKVKAKNKGEVDMYFVIGRKINY